MATDRAVTARSAGVPYVTQLSDGVHAWRSDTAPSNGGADAAQDPESLVLGALGACTAITVRMYAARKQWPLEAVDVRLHYTRRDATGKAEEQIRVGADAAPDVGLVAQRDARQVADQVGEELQVQVRLPAAVDLGCAEPRDLVARLDVA